MQLFFGREERDLEFVQKRMDLLNYSLERLLDVAAALVLRAGYRWVDRYFAAAGTRGDAADAGVPLGTAVVSVFVVALIPAIKGNIPESS